MIKNIILKGTKKMTRNELYKMGFEKAVTELSENNDIISAREILKDFAIKEIDSENLFVAIHILNALNDSDANYYNYDYSMGTLDTPMPIETLEDLEYFCDEED